MKIFNQITKLIKFQPVSSRIQLAFDGLDTFTQPVRNFLSL